MHSSSVKEGATMPAEGWDDDFWRGIGLGDLADESYERIGESSLSPLYEELRVGTLRKKRKRHA